MIIILVFTSACSFGQHFVDIKVAVIEFSCHFMSILIMMMFIISKSPLNRHPMINSSLIIARLVNVHHALFPYELAETD